MEKTITKTVYIAEEVTLNYVWIPSKTEPEAPDGYTRAPEWDFNFGDLGIYWAFVKTV